MKKIFSIIRALFMLFGFTGCSNIDFLSSLMGGGSSFYTGINKMNSQIVNPFHLKPEEFVNELNGLIKEDNDKIKQNDTLSSTTRNYFWGSFNNDYRILISPDTSNTRVVSLSLRTPYNVELTEEVVNYMDNAPVKRALIEMLFTDKSVEDKEDILRKTSIGYTKENGNKFTETINDYYISTSYTESYGKASYSLFIYKSN